MKIVNVKAMVAKVFTVGLLAGAFAIAAPKAEAQVAFGVRVGPVAVFHHPAYRAPVYVGPAYPYGYGYGFRPGFYGRPYGWDHDRHFYGREREDFRRR